MASAGGAGSAAGVEGAAGSVGDGVVAAGGVAAGAADGVASGGGEGPASGAASCASATLLLRRQKSATERAQRVYAPRDRRRRERDEKQGMRTGYGNAHAMHPSLGDHRGIHSASSLLHRRFAGEKRPRKMWIRMKPTIVSAGRDVEPENVGLRHRRRSGSCEPDFRLLSRGCRDRLPRFTRVKRHSRRVRRAPARRTWRVATHDRA